MLAHEDEKDQCSLKLKRGLAGRSCGGHDSKQPHRSPPVDAVTPATEKPHQLLSARKKEPSTQSESCFAPCLAPRAKGKSQSWGQRAGLSREDEEIPTALKGSSHGQPQKPAC